MPFPLRLVALRAPAFARWVGVVVLVVMVIGTFGANHGVSLWAPVWLAALIAAGASLPLVLDVPVPIALTATGTLTAVYLGLGYSDGPTDFALPVVAFVVAFTATRRYWTWLVAAAVLAVVGLIARGAWHHAQRPVWWESVGILALIAAAATGASAFRSNRSAAAERARSIVSEERLRMAADLHDGVGHGLAVIAMQAGAALHVLDKDPASVRTNLEAIRETSRESLDLLRAELASLAGVGHARRTPSPTLADIHTLVERVSSGGLDVHLSLTTDDVPMAAGRVAYAVVQEGLTNVLRHAGATQAIVIVEHATGELLVTVADDGRGSTGSTTGQGIAGMRSRVEELGGTFEAGPATSGFRVQARIPIGPTP